MHTDTTYRIEGKPGEPAPQSAQRKKAWRTNRSAKGLSMVTTNLDGFSLAKCRRFAKFAKLSPRQTFPPYGIQNTSQYIIVITTYRVKNWYNLFLKELRFVIDKIE